MTNKQANEVKVLLNLARLLIVAAFALGGWQTFVQMSIMAHHKDIGEIKQSALNDRMDGVVRLKEWSTWREAMVSISARQTTLLEIHQAEILQLQARGEPHFK